eukprot:1753983-Prymnesium_polylepis.1
MPPSHPPSCAPSSSELRFPCFQAAPPHREFPHRTALVRLRIVPELPQHDRSRFLALRSSLEVGGRFEQAQFPGQFRIQLVIVTPAPPRPRSPTAEHGLSGRDTFVRSIALS